MDAPYLWSHEARFFVLRTPLLPAERGRWGALLSAPGAAPEALDEALRADRRALQEAFRALVADPAVREALFVASPDLEESLAIWLEQPEHPHARGVPATLYRYLSRMALRSTPFGLFAGCSTGVVGPATRLALEPRIARHTRLDMEYLCALGDAVASGARDRIRWRANDSLYRAAGQYRYAEARVDPETRARRNDQVSLEATDAIDAVLARAPATRAGLAEAVRALHPEVSLEDAAAFVDGLTDAQVLLPELGPAVTGEEPLADFIAQLRLAAPDIADRLAGVRSALAALDASGPGAPVARYREITGALSAMPAAPDPRRLYHVDLYKPANALSLGPQVTGAIEEAIRLLAAITPWRELRPLTRLREGFVQRWGGGEVALTDLLDDERGLGFGADGTGNEPSPLLKGLDFPAEPEASRTPFGPRERWMLRRLQEATPGGEWALNERDLEQLRAPAGPPLPDAFSFMGVLAAASDEAVDQGDFQLYAHGMAGPSGARLLGRFCLGDAALRAHVEEHVRAEEALQPEAAFAEIVHLPQGRLGNVLGRPALRGWEIAYLGRSGLPADRQLSVTELRFSLAGLDGQRIVLRSARLDREVVPRLSSAHNHIAADLPLYRFLGALQEQGTRSRLGWDWGPLAGAAFLPRVRRGRIVLALARWNLHPSELAPLVDASSTERLLAVRRLRAARGIPRDVSAVQADNLLPLDLENPLALEALAGLARPGTELTLEEVWPSPEQRCVEGPGGRFAHELLVPFVRRQPLPRARPPRAAPAPRVWMPGSPWLFLKIYTGTLTTDAVLAEVIAPLVAEARRAGAIDRWFFLRYTDPDWHLRIRLRGTEERVRELLGQVYAALEPWRADGRVWRLDVDTYQPEIDRYGGARGLELSEQLFEADSDAILGIVGRLSGDAGADARWRLALRSMHLLLGDLGLDAAQRMEVLARVREAFARRHRVDQDKGFQAQLNRRFRREWPGLRDLIADAWAPEHPLASGFELLAQRSEQMAPIAAGLREAERQGELTAPVAVLADSYLHMTANRLLRSDHLHQELVLYDFLLRLYRSEAARKAGG